MLNKQLYKELAPYPEAMELKELGFDEPCFGWFASDKSLVKDITIKTDFTLAPTFSQAFRWFRDKHYLIAGIFPNNHSLSNKPSYISYVGKFKKGTIEVCSNYEEAELACLRELIEIVKKKQDVKQTII